MSGVSDFGTVDTIQNARELGARIASAREAAGMSQDEFANAVGVSNGTVRNWEKGRASPRDSIGRIEQVLSIQLRDYGSREPRLGDASHAQILAELGRRDADKDAQIAKLIGSQPPSPLARRTTGRVLRAARTRQPEKDGPDGDPQ